MPLGIIPILILTMTIPNVYAGGSAGGDANPYCDLLSIDERRDVTCHDRRDASDATGLVNCNDGSEREFEDWEDCPDVSGYDYNNGDE